MSPQSYDFTRPPRLPSALKAQLVPWLQRANAIFAESLAAMGLSIQAQSLDQTTGWPLETLDQWLGKPIGLRVAVANNPTILALPNRLAQSLVALFLGDSPPTDASERELTPIELSLCELAAEMFVSSLREAWLGEAPVILEVREREPNLRRSKVFRPQEPLVICRSLVKVGDVEQFWSWLVPLELLQDLFGTEVTPRVAAPTETAQRQMESLVRGMTLPLVVKLGHAELTAPQLSELQIGDVVVLRQRTTEPLQASLAGNPAFLGWPGRIGNKQAFQIEAEVSPRHRGGRLS